MATYQLSCRDINGNLCCPPQPMGERKNRIFDPTGNSRYTSDYGVPLELTHPTKVDGLTYLCYGSKHNLTKDEITDVKKHAKRSGHKLKEALTNGIQYDTVVVQAAYRTRHGDAIGGRYFAEDSPWNRSGMPELRKSKIRALCGTIDIVCQQLQEIVTQKRHIKKVYFQVSSQEVIDIANNIWDWQQNGYPALPPGVDSEDCIMLHHNVRNLEAKNEGIEVKFWLVEQVHLSGAIFNINCRFDDLHHVPNECVWDDKTQSAVPRIGCPCGNCLFAIQTKELLFAASGTIDSTQARDIIYIGLAKKYKKLKAGDKFPLTNNAGIDFMLTMKADASFPKATQKLLDDPMSMQALMTSLPH